MSQKSGAIGFGGFLIGLGIGYLVFKQLNITFNEAAWALIILGVAIVLSAVIRSISPGLGIHRIVGGLAGGLILALFLTQGFNFLSGVNIGNPFLPYSSTETKTYSGLSTQGAVNLKLGSMNGDITLSTWNRSEYSITSTITARGITQQEADNNLANLSKNIIDTETTTQQSLALIYNSQTLVNNPYQIKVDVKLPANSVLNLELTTSNANIVIADVNGGVVNLDTSNGAVRINNVNADKITAETSNSPITGIVGATTCQLSTSNSPINIQVVSSKSGDYTLQTSNSNIDVTMPSTADCKLDASTSNSAVTFGIPNFTYSRDTSTSKAGQTSSFDSSQFKISVNAQTSNSEIRIHR